MKVYRGGKLKETPEYQCGYKQYETPVLNRVTSYK